MSDEPSLMTVNELAARNGVSVAVMYYSIRELMRRGYLTKTTVKRGNKECQLIDVVMYDAVKEMLPAAAGRKAQQKAHQARMAEQAGKLPVPAQTIQTISGAPGVPIDSNGAVAPNLLTLSYTDELARKTRADAEMQEHKLARARQQVLDRTEVQAAVERCAELIIRELERLPALADDIFRAGVDHGVNGTRTALREHIHKIRAALMTAMTGAVIVED